MLPTKWEHFVTAFSVERTLDLCQASLKQGLTTISVEYFPVLDCQLPACVTQLKSFQFSLVKNSTHQCFSLQKEQIATRLYCFANKTSTLEPWMLPVQVEYQGK